MSDPHSADAAVKLKAIRFALIQLENGLNAADHELLWSLFADTGVVITPTTKVTEFPHRRLYLPQLLLSEVDTLPACTLIVNDVLLLSRYIAWADMSLHLRLGRHNTVVEISHKYWAVLEQRALTAGWLFVLLQHNYQVHREVESNG